MGPRQKQREDRALRGRTTSPHTIDQKVHGPVRALGIQARVWRMPSLQVLECKLSDSKALKPNTQVTISS